MPKNLLVADDSITIQKVVGITFAGEDFRITAVDNGDDALSRARELKPDLILADVVMPRKNGYEVCEAVKADPALRHIPVLLLAGTFEAFDEARARAVHADAHIAKPFESQALLTKVKELLERPAQPAVPARAAAPVKPTAPLPPPAAARPPPARPPPGTPPPARPLGAAPHMSRQLAQPAGPGPVSTVRPAGAPPIARPPAGPPPAVRPPVGAAPPVAAKRAPAFSPPTVARP
ncbi:MAG TPA: response regulator, partial [Anaeromyxobacteraceae bacterium]